MLRSRVNGIVITGLIVLAPHSAMAWNTNDNWCGKDALDVLTGQTNVPRGVGYSALQTGLFAAGSWWWDIQAGLGMGFVSGSFGGGVNDTWDPGHVELQCRAEQSFFINSPNTYGFTTVQPAWHPTCDFFGVNNDSWVMILRSDWPLPDGTVPVCTGSGTPTKGSGWGLTHSDVVAGKLPLYKAITHEFGHAMGLSHSSDADAIMFPTTGTNNHVSPDDADGIIIGQGEDKRYRTIRTVSATKVASGTALTFGTTSSTHMENALWLPAIAGNRGALAPGAWGEWGVAWVDFDYHLIFGKGTEGAAVNDPVAVTGLNTGEFTRNSPGIAINNNGTRIGIAFAGTEGTVNFITSTDAGSSWAKTTFWGYKAIGGVSVAYSEPTDKWVVLWVADRADTNAYTILHRISLDGTGTTWGTNVWTMGSDFSMPSRQPAVTCQRADLNQCVVAFNSFGVATMPFRTAPARMGQVSLELTDPIVDTNPSRTSYTNPAIVRYTQGSSSGHLITFGQPDAIRGRMNYALLTDASGPAAKFTNVQQWSTGPLSRSGFAAAWNSKRSRFRFIWRED